MKVDFIEVYKRTVEVDADNFSDALDIAEDMMKNYEVVLDESDLCYSDIREHKEEGHAINI